MSKILLRWRRIPLKVDATTLKEKLTRSSHALAVIDSTAHVFGGEKVPRQPVDSVLYSVNLLDGTVNNCATGLEARVGNTLNAISNKLYVFGGRGSVDMSPLPPILHQTSLNDLTIFSNSAPSQTVQGLSYHTCVAHQNELYLHAGCPAKGRLASLHSFDTERDPYDWVPLDDAPEQPRGGTAIARIVTSQGPMLARFGGFAGFELGGPLHLFDITKRKWSTASMSSNDVEPSNRSVHTFIGINPIDIEGNQSIVAVLMYGEADPAPADLGHAGAGQFHSDVWLLLVDGHLSFSWKQIQSEGNGLDAPSARGWHASAFYEKENSIIIHGGLDASNSRLNDMWQLSIEQAP